MIEFLWHVIRLGNKLISNFVICFVLQRRLSCVSRRIMEFMREMKAAFLWLKVVRINMDCYYFV